VCWLLKMATTSSQGHLPAPHTRHTHARISGQLADDGQANVILVLLSNREAGMRRLDDRSGDLFSYIRRRSAIVNEVLFAVDGTSRRSAVGPARAVAPVLSPQAF
jgi:hypothetical protein